MHLVIMILGGLLGGITAYYKGRNIFFWTVVCGFPLSLLILLALPRLPREGQWRPCPFCLRIIPWQAQVCAQCRRDVPPPHNASCKYCNSTVWAGQDRCPRCGNPAPWIEEAPIPITNSSSSSNPDPKE